MENESPFLSMRRAETHLKDLTRSIDTDLLEPDEKKAVASLRRLSSEARLDIRDYELSETRAEQLKKAAEAQERLANLKATVIDLSGLFGPADIAELDAQLEHIKGQIV